MLADSGSSAPTLFLQSGFLALLADLGTPQSYMLKIPIITAYLIILLIEAKLEGTFCKKNSRPIKNFIFFHAS